jgi:predicted nucleic acid-binding Zn ribbon protein
MRRRAPRALSIALERVVPDVAPATLLAQVQQAWPEVAGERLAAEAGPVSERDGVVTVACTSGVWAQELDLLGADLLAGLNAALETGSETPAAAAKIAKLRFVVSSAPNRA